ncbi:MULTISPECIES: glycosyltransferase family 2 protein [unclassified Pyramidobacter]|uniref:glycosyltransferase family 2 protein n=1 Tax=unclassified Pyramidobacter TaxID=2632171 RepID=UPI000EA2C311|nr:glycosyltransferase family 2 protein [Pyramidobacter sp. CG50-2]RKJ80233.1 glycosyltransferase family 2 protein [Pyramidobacter sp. CG50-2]
MINLSLYIITYNEEKRLPQTLEAAHRLADEIIVVDSGSTDKTREIALRYGARFYYNEWVSFGDQVRVAEEYCANDWVLRLDADEVLSEELSKEIEMIKQDPDCDGYRLRIGDVYPGVPRPIRWAKHYKLIRLYNRKKMRMLGILDHDAVDPLAPDVRVRTLRGFVCHHSYLTLSHVINKQNRATDTQIQMLVKGQKRYSPLRMLGTATLTFLRTYFLNRHFLYGYWGFINASTLAFFRFVKFAKWYEREQLEKLSSQ